MAKQQLSLLDLTASVMFKAAEQHSSSSNDRPDDSGTRLAKRSKVALCCVLLISSCWPNALKAMGN